MTAPLLSSSPRTSTKQEKTLNASPPNSAKQNFADLHATTNSAVASSPFPLAAMASMTPRDELSFAPLPPASPQPQFVTTPKLLPTPMPPPLPQHQLFPAQSSPDVLHPTPQKLFLPLPRSYPLSSSQQLRPTAFRLLVQPGEYWIPDLCCLPNFSLIALGFQWFTLSHVHKLEFEPPT